MFPDLPPELRNEIYTYLSTPGADSRPMNLHLPLQLKTFLCKHTTVQICPIHHGSTGLLALPLTRYLEVREYASWLLNNGVSLQIAVHFKGRINTFTQGDWDKKIATHLRKLAKLHPWLRKVAKYDIHVLWDPLDGALKSKNNKRKAALVPLDMARTLTQLLDRDIMSKHGHVRVALHVGHKFAVENAMTTTKFGFGVFLGDKQRLEGFRGVVKEVWKAPCVFAARQTPSSANSGLLVLPAGTGTAAAAATADEPLMGVEDGVVRWSVQTRGQLVMRKNVNAVAGGEGVYEYGNGELEFPLCQILAECVEQL